MLTGQMDVIVRVIASAMTLFFLRFADHLKIIPHIIYNMKNHI